MSKIIILILVSQGVSMVKQDEVQLEGRVVDGEMGMPVPGANVIEIGKSNWVLTNFDGKFSTWVTSSAVVEINFIHLWSPRRDALGNFPVADYLVGNVDMYAVMKTLVLEREKRFACKRQTLPGDT